MITLWHCRDARSFRPLWALEELGLPYELKLLPFPPRFHARDYLDENPLGTIPLLVDGETRMTESSAMIEYLSMRHGNGALSVRPDEAGYGAYLNGLLYGEATLTFPQTLVLRYTRLSPRIGAIPRSPATTPAGSWRGCAAWTPGSRPRRSWPANASPARTFRWPTPCCWPRRWIFPTSFPRP